MQANNIQPGLIIIPHGVVPESHELETAQIFTALGKNVEFICPSRTKGVANPDVIIDGLRWEIKCPQGRSRWTIMEQLRRAARQSPNVILDSRHTKTSNQQVKKQIQHYFSLHKSIKKLILIEKSGNLVDFHK